MKTSIQNLTVLFTLGLPLLMAPGANADVTLTPTAIPYTTSATCGLAVSPDESKLYVAIGKDENSSCVLEYHLLDPCAAIADLLAAVAASGLSSKEAHPLLVSLEAAGASCDRNNRSAAANQLGAFQQKVRAQVAKKHPALAGQWIQAAQQIIDQLRADPLQSGLVAWYPFDGNTLNVLGTGNNGVANGATLTTDRFGNPDRAYALAGYDSIGFPSGPPLSPTGSFTYSFWMQSTRDGDYPVYDPYSWLWFVDRTVETDPLVSLALLTGDVQTSRKGQFALAMRYDDTTGPSPTGFGLDGGELRPQQWQHFAIVRDYGTAFRLYVDGQLVASGDDNGKALTPPPVKLGMHAWDGQMGLQGKFDDFRIYNRVLTVEEINRLQSAN